MAKKPTTYVSKATPAGVQWFKRIPASQVPQAAKTSAAAARKKTK